MKKTGKTHIVVGLTESIYLLLWWSHVIVVISIRIGFETCTHR